MVTHVPVLPVKFALSGVNETKNRALWTLPLCSTTLTSSPFPQDCCQFGNLPAIPLLRFTVSLGRAGESFRHLVNWFVTGKVKLIKLSEQSDYPNGQRSFGKSPRPAQWSLSVFEYSPGTLITNGNLPNALFLSVKALGVFPLWRECINKWFCLCEMQSMIGLTVAALLWPQLPMHLPFCLLDLFFSLTVLQTVN